MILKINGNIDLPSPNKISISNSTTIIPQVLQPVVIETKSKSKNTMNPKLKKFLISSSIIALSIGIKPLLAFASSNELFSNIPDGLLGKTPSNELLKNIPKNLPNIAGNDYHKSFWYRHSGVLSRIAIDKKHGVNFWEQFGENLFKIAVAILKGIAKALGKFILLNGDLFFLLPAVLTLLMTFFVGKHKYSKYTLFLFFAYFVSQVFKGFLM
jgi:hypothetical protein